MTSNLEPDQTHRAESLAGRRLTPEGLAVLFTGARTAHDYTAEPVSDEELVRILELYRWAPTTSNAQPMRVMWVRTQEGKERMLPHVWENNHKYVLNAPVTAILAYDDDWHRPLPELFPAVPGLVDRLEADDRWKRRSGELSAHLQAGYLMLAARALGYGIGPMEGFNFEDLDRAMFTDRPWHSFLLVSVGHSTGHFPWKRGPRLDDDVIMAWA